MSGEDNGSLGSVQDHQDQGDGSNLQIRLRACEACKMRKTAPRPSHPRRQRATLSSQHENQIEKINSQLLQLQASLDALKSSPSHVNPPSNNPTRDSFQPPITRSDPRSYSSPNDFTGAHYLGESSFDVHSQQIGEVLDKNLQNSPASAMNQDISSLLSHQRNVIEADKNGADAFIRELPLPPVHMALAILRLVDVLPYGFFFCAPIVDFALFKEICQKVYFPANGYTKSDFVVVNGGLAGILSKATHDELKICSIDPKYAAEIISLCEGNVTSVIERLGSFFEPSFANLRIILFTGQMTVTMSNLHRAWRSISIASRLCLDLGLNRLRESPDDPELNEKKTCFWFCYTLDRALSLNFGRSPNMPDFDITTSYPTVPNATADSPFGGKFFSLAFVWFDLAKVQSQIYERLYSAKGELEDPQTRSQTARRLAVELISLRERCQIHLDTIPDKEKDPFLDSEMSVLSNLTLVYRALQDTKPTHPLRFPDECIETARQALHLNQTLYERFIKKTDIAVKTHTPWTISFCPFTPYTVVLGTAILNKNTEDVELCRRTVVSLDEMANRAPWVKKLANTCRVLFQGAQSCIAQGLRDPQPSTHGYQQLAQASSLNQENTNPSHGFPLSTADHQWNQVSMIDDWGILPPPKNADEMFQLFDNFLAGNPPSMMSILEADMGLFDPK